jgi:CTP synthase
MIIEGKIKVIRHARENKIPFFGICLGMQLAVIEFARHVCGLTEAHSSEFNRETPDPIICLLKEWYDYQKKSIQRRDEASELGGTMRLGEYPCDITEGTFAFEAYRKQNIFERHRHRFEFNNPYRELVVKNGMVLSGICPDADLVEIVELPGHPWFLGCQFHPEFKSRPMDPHPLFKAFIKASLQRKNML